MATDDHLSDPSYLEDEEFETPSLESLKVSETDYSDIEEGGSYEEDRNSYGDINFDAGWAELKTEELTETNREPGLNPEHIFSEDYGDSGRGPLTSD